MAESAGRPLITCPEAYSKSLQIFIASLQQEGHSTTPSLKCIEEHAASLISDYVGDFLRGQLPFYILGVGSGDGSSDISFIEILSRICQKSSGSRQFVQRTIEPDQRVLEVFLTKAQRLPESLKSNMDIEFQWHPTTFQEYVEQKKKDDAKFQVVHFFHSLYYTGLETALEHCYGKELGEKGVILSILNDEQSSMSKYYRAFSSQGMILNREAYRDSKDISDVAKKNGWKYLECPGETMNCDITAIFDRHSVKGNLLLDFLTHWVNAGETAGQANLQKILSFWRGECIEDCRGRKILKWKTKAVMILKGM